MLPKNKNQVPETMEIKLKFEPKYTGRINLDMEDINKQYSYKGDVPHLATRHDFNGHCSYGNQYKVKFRAHLLVKMAFLMILISKNQFHGKILNFYTVSFLGLHMFD